TSGTVRSTPLLRPRTVMRSVGSTLPPRLTRPRVRRMSAGSTRAAMLIPYQVPGFESANGVSSRRIRVGGRSGSTLGIGTRLAYVDGGAGIARGDHPVEAPVRQRHPELAR